jgi:predicted nucleotidyltransferase
MRLTDTERRILRDAARDAFGDEVRVYLFGSRVDDAKRGGDIDLLVETGSMDSDAIFAARIRFLARVKLALGEQKIDLVIDYAGRKIRPPILDMAKMHGVRL